MKKQFWILTIQLFLIFLLTACGLGHEEREHLEAINPAEWPTPRAEVGVASPTPFPKSTLPVEPTPSTGSPADETSAPPVPTEPALDTTSVAAEAGLGSNSDLRAALTSQALNQFSVVATGVVAAPDLAIRGGPGANYASINSIEPGAVFGILGKNPNGDWLYVVDASLSPGWLPASGLRVVGPLENAPVLPPNPMAALIAESGLSPVSAGSGETITQVPQTNTPAQPAVTADDFTPVAQASVNVSSANVRQGPGPDYDQLGTILEDTEVEILAVNKTQDWALISTPDLEAGWIYLNTLTVDSNLTDAPVVYSARPDDNLPTGQIAPISRVVGENVSTTTAGGSTAGSQAILVAAVSESDTTSPFNGLGTLTTAHLNKREVSLRWGPGVDYGEIDELTSDDINVDILAQDESGQWVFVRVQRFEQDLGWIAVEDLMTISGSLANAPQIITARVNSNEVEVRSGPSIAEDKTGLLSINTIVMVLGLDDQRSWALIQLTNGDGLGWLPLRFLEISRPLRDIPQAPAIPARPQPAVEAPAPPPISPRPVEASQLVIQLSSGGDIMVINPDGSGLRRLTNGIDPALSPDGQAVAFTRWQGETGSLWLTDIDGSNERQVLGSIKQAKGAEWSPDGSQVVVNFQQGGNLKPSSTCTDLTQDNPRAFPFRRATNVRGGFDSNGDPQLCWDLPPDPFWDLKVISLADSSSQDLDGGTYAFRPAWDPSQPWRIISDGGRGLLAVSIADDYRQEISDNVSDSSPVFSPDGRYVALTAGQQGGSSGYDIYRLNRDGSGRVRLTETPLWVPIEPDSNGKQWNNVAPAWSPDSSQIAFLTDRTGRWEIWLMNADGSNPHPMFSDEINAQLPIEYNFVDERVMSWR